MATAHKKRAPQINGRLFFTKQMILYGMILARACTGIISEPSSNVTLNINAISRGESGFVDGVVTTVGYLALKAASVVVNVAVVPVPGMGAVLNLAAALFSVPGLIPVPPPATVVISRMVRPVPAGIERVYEIWPAAADTSMNGLNPNVVALVYVTGTAGRRS